MKKYLLCLCFIILPFESFTHAQKDPKIATIINQVNIDSLYENLNYLTGQKLVKSSFGEHYITSRYYLNTGNLIAEEYLENRLSTYFPATTAMQYFDGSGGNVIAVQRGTKFPDKYIIIGAHFDSMPNQGPAPGADDNGSGTSAVLEAARILSKFITDYSIVYALWDNEEIGLKGSYHHAQQASSKKDDIIAVINMDMIGYDGNNDYLAEIHTRSIANSNQIANTILKINADYGIGLQPLVISPGTTASDQSSFWNFNYSAVLLIEGYYSKDFNPHYHSSFDNMNYINKEYYLKCAKAAIGTLSSYAGIGTAASLQESLPSVFQLDQNYPNPFNPSTKIKYSIGNESHVKLVVYDALGKEVSVLIDRYQRADNYEVKFDAGSRSSGIYFYALYAGDQVKVRKMVLAK
ncbi:MAG: hypothetical protein CVV24_05425 [Ignavibacteriae bacterium HGW-Ignavibacteriae-3]|nr:MAG: hypothetical protein CVV24_05425 [Ignavibacteriae bacterium HGW-Ignavibacteriae-3]